MQKNILILKIGGIGDVIMSLPMATAIRKEHPYVKITWICGMGTYPIVKLSMLVDEIIVVDEKKLFRGTFLQKISQILKTWKKIGFFRKFSFLLIGYQDWRYHLLTLWTRYSEKRSFRSKKKRKNLIHDRYVPNEYVRLFSQTDGPDISFADMPHVTIPPTRKWDSYFLSSSSTYVALAPGGGKNILSDEELRRWPIEHYIELAKSLRNQGYEIFVTGGKEDQLICEQFPNNLVHLLVGQTNVEELLALYARCHLLITHDCGSFHLARLVGTKVLGLFGPTNPIRLIPRKKETSTFFLWGGENCPCSPCYDGKKYFSCERNICMKSLSTTMVLGKVKDILKK